MARACVCDHPQNCFALSVASDGLWRVADPRLHRCGLEARARLLGLSRYDTRINSSLWVFCVNAISVLLPDSRIFCCCVVTDDALYSLLLVGDSVWAACGDRCVSIWSVDKLN